MSEKLIPLTKGFSAIVDEADFERVSQFKWFANVRETKNGLLVYAARNAPRPKRGFIPLHRMILEAGPEYHIDHINHNGLDCRRENLRLCTPIQNGGNARHAVGKAGYRGVRISGHKFQVRLAHAGKTICLGGFSSAEDAARARDALAIELLGEFAILNFPSGLSHSQSVA